MRDETFIEFESDDVMNGTIRKDNKESRHRIHYEAVKDYYLAYSTCRASFACAFLPAL